MKEITMYTKVGCPYCAGAKELFRSLDITFKEVDVTEDQKTRDMIKEKYDWHTVPAVFIDGELVGGFDDITKLHESGKLMEMVG